MAGKDGRSNCWAFLLWPESMPPFSLAYLKECKLPVYVSPLHDRDVMTLEDCLEARERGDFGCHVGDIKKPHYHCMIHFASNKSSAQVLHVLSPLKVQWVLQLGTSELAAGLGWRGYARYLIHADDPQKAQYDRKDVLAFNAPDYNVAAALNLSASRAWALTPVFDFCRDNDITDWAFLVDYLRAERADLFELAFNNSGKVIQYLKSMTWRKYKAPEEIRLAVRDAGGSITTPPQHSESESATEIVVANVC